MSDNDSLLFSVVRLLFVFIVIPFVLITAYGLAQHTVENPTTYTITAYNANGEKETFENVTGVSEGMFGKTVSFWKDGKHVSVNTESFTVTQN